MRLYVLAPGVAAQRGRPHTDEMLRPLLGWMCGRLSFRHLGDWELGVVKQEFKTVLNIGGPGPA